MLWLLHCTDFGSCLECLRQAASCAQVWHLHVLYLEARAIEQHGGLQLVGCLVGMVPKDNFVLGQPFSGHVGPWDFNKGLRPREDVRARDTPHAGSAMERPCAERCLSHGGVLL